MLKCRRRKVDNAVSRRQRKMRTRLDGDGRRKYWAMGNWASEAQDPRTQTAEGLRCGFKKTVEKEDRARREAQEVDVEDTVL